MITSQDAVTIQKALNLAVQAGQISVTDSAGLVTRIIAMIPSQPKVLTHCQKCGRATNDPDNKNCDMQPCHFA